MPCPLEDREMTYMSFQTTSNMMRLINNNLSPMLVSSLINLLQFHSKKFRLFTARKRSLGQDNIFIGVCQEFCSQAGSASLHAGIPPPREQTPPGSRHPPTPQWKACWEIQSTSGRYASYWNAFLFSRDSESVDLCFEKFCFEALRSNK